MFSYGVTLVSIAATALFGGWFLGKRSGSSRQRSQRWFLSGTIGLTLLWFALSYGARLYAETDKFGWTTAEWFAQRGKWFLFLVGFFSALGFAAAAEKARSRGSQRRALVRRFLLVAIGVLVCGAVFNRTVPIYPWLDAGRHDERGLMRQSLEYEFTCAPVALANYLERYAGRSALSEQAISRDCKTTREGSLLSDVLRAAIRHGLDRAECRKLTLAELEGRNLPAIVSISTLPGLRHATLLVRLDSSTAYFLDPAYGEWSVPLTRFEQIWYGKTLVLDPR